MALTKEAAQRGARCLCRHQEQTFLLSARNYRRGPGEFRHVAVGIIEATGSILAEDVHHRSDIQELDVKLVKRFQIWGGRKALPTLLYEVSKLVQWSSHILTTNWPQQQCLPVGGSP